MQTQLNELQKQIGKNLQTLKMARDDIRVRAHLFAMDVRSAWKELEPQLEHAEKAAEKATQASATALHEAVQALDAFRKRLKA